MLPEPFSSADVATVPIVCYTLWAMASPYRSQVIELLQRRFGATRKLKGSESLLVVGDEAARIYFRYSKVHAGGRTFFGLREVDLRQLEGHNSYLCLLLGDGSPPLFIPYADFEEVFHNADTARDGQYKVQLYTEGALQLYIARQGRSTLRDTLGWEHSKALWTPSGYVKLATFRTPRCKRY